MIKCLLFICVGLICSIVCQKLSPCPGVFNYEQNNYQGRWDGQIRLQTDEELSGVFVTIVLDHTAEKLVNWFGETITRNNKEFTIRNNDYILVPGINVTLKFYVEFNDAEVPSVTTIRLNGRTICSETKKVKLIPSPAPFVSMKITPRTTARVVIPTTSSFPIYRDPTRNQLSDTTEHNFDTPGRSAFIGSSDFNSGQNNSRLIGSGFQPVSASNRDQEYHRYVPSVEASRSSVNKNNNEFGKENVEYKSDNGYAEVKLGNRNGETLFEETYNRASTTSRNRQSSTTTTTRRTTRFVPSGSQPLSTPNKYQEYDQYVPKVEDNRSSVNKNNMVFRKENIEYKSDNGYAEAKLANRNSETVFEENYNRASTPLRNRHSSITTSTRRTTSKITTHKNNSREVVPPLDYIPIQSNYRCGKPTHIAATPLILYGQNSTEGEWPWHLAIYKNLKGILKYICGGSMISNNYIVTAAHCVTNPETGESLSPHNFVIYIGTTSIKNLSPGVQIVQVGQIKVHSDYNHENFHNDIALLKTVKPIEYTNNVIPVCLWKDGDDLNEVVGVLGTVVGWGLDENNRISEILKRTEMPIVNTVACIYSKPDFFGRFTSLTSFCAGFRNGSNACNGDSGSGMVIAKTDDDASVTWYLRGFVSTSVPIKDKTVCDPYNYIIFTDVAKFTSWIRKVMENDDY